MPDKLYQECRTVISGCRAIFEDLRESGVDFLPVSAETSLVFASSQSGNSDRNTQREKPSAAETLMEIQQELVDCCRCSLHEERTHTLIGSGNPNARLVLIGGTPDSDEDSQGESFVGEAGQLLDRILGAMKLTREEVYICHLVKCRPVGDRAPEKSELLSCEAFLKRQLLVIAPEIIISLGDLATRTLLKTDTPVSKLRGKWQSYEEIPLMATFDPAYLLDQPAGKHQVWEDMKQVIHRLQESSA